MWSKKNGTCIACLARQAARLTVLKARPLKYYCLYRRKGLCISRLLCMRDSHCTKFGKWIKGVADHWRTGSFAGMRPSCRIAFEMLDAALSLPSGMP
jgi:hypothetical protein